MYRKFRCKIPMNLQFFADNGGGAAGGGAGSGDGAGNGAGTGTDGQGAGTGGAAETIDYNKIQTMLEGTLKAKEETALKSYFKQQGLSQEEAEKAMAAFKAERDKNQPDVGAMQTQVTAAQAEAQQARIETAATMTAVGLGLDSKTIPYVLKMADLSQVVGTDGKINDETLKAALNKVLEDVPALKPQAAASNGFVQVGTGGNTGQQESQESQLSAIFGNKK